MPQTIENAFIFHGTCGWPERNWFPWLKTRLLEIGIQTTVPRLPTPEGQSVTNWRAAIAPYRADIGPQTLLIGHSSGANFILHLLETLDNPVAHAVLVGMPIAPTGLKDIDALNESFFNHAFAWEKIAAHSKGFSLLHGDDDPYVPLSQAQEASHRLNAPLTIVKNGGHLNQDSGYTEFPEVLERIKKLVRPLSDTTSGTL